MFCVDLKTDCKHANSARHIPHDIAERFLAARRVIAANICQECPSDVENWLCAASMQVRCSRYVHGHAASHAERSGHAIAVSLSDLSVWCFSCDAYIAAPTLAPLLDALHEMKFGNVRPDAIQRTEEELQLIQQHNNVPVIDTNEVRDTHLAPTAARIAELLSTSQRVVFFTGAGLSTTAGIRDFRGPDGLWTLQARGEKPKLSMRLADASPTFAHEFIARFVASHTHAFVVSQNVDNLHGRSRIPKAALAELHGNAFVEKCTNCNAEFVRDFDVVAQRGVDSSDTRKHATGRICALCRGTLVDTIVSFGENLPESTLKLAIEKSEQADLFVVLGSSLRVTPASDMPELALANGATLVIVNKQETPLDHKAHVLYHGDIEELMKLVAQQM